MHWLLRPSVTMVAVGLAIVLGTSPAWATTADDGGGLWMGGRAVPLSATTGELPIPSFSRQTKLPCNTCHTAFLQLTSFGRAFKLNGYTMVGIEQVKAGPGAAGEGLSLDLIPPFSGMIQTSLTRVAHAPPGTQNDQVELPDQMSLFLGGAITPQIGMFVQLTYAGPDGAFGWDNVDVRYVGHTTLVGKPLVFGATLNNNPTVQDPWNGTPAWGWPFAGSSVAPTPAAATLVEGGLAQRVAGLGAYTFWNNLLYAELTAYRSAPQGGPHPADASAEQTIDGISPYWRVALSRESGAHALEVGTFGLVTRQYPSGVTGTTNRYVDIGVDGQYQHDFGGSSLAVHARYIHERQSLDAFVGTGDAANSRNALRTWQADAQLVLESGLAPGFGYFGSSGDVDRNLYPAGAVDGSATGRPNSSGFIAELDYNPWLNARIAAQYVLYTGFNGSGDDYDGAGRDASANNTLYLLVWLLF